LARQDPACERLMTVPGIGPIIARSGPMIASATAIAAIVYFLPHVHAEVNG